MRSIRYGACLALLTGGLAVAPIGTSTAATPAPAAPDSLLEQARDTADGSLSITRSTATGKVGFLAGTGADGDLLPDVSADSAATAAAKATAYLDEYAGLFGARADELVAGPVSSSESAGWTVTFTQQYRGLDVFASMLKVNVDADGDLTSVNGFVAPDLELDTTADLSPAAAGTKAVAAVRADPPGGDGVRIDAGRLRAREAHPMVYREGAVRGLPGENRLVQYVEVSNGGSIREAVFLDAGTGELVNRYSLDQDGLERHLYERSYGNSVWAEGDPFPGVLSQWQQSEVLSTGEAYWLFENTFGRDSYDGRGHEMETVNNDPSIQCPNANWNGRTTNYCDGTATDDVVAHEWGHAYTQYTGGLVYQWQSGALNESYSDVWGETLDLLNDRSDDDEGDLSTPRPVGACSQHTGALVEVEINAPESIKKLCDAGAASFGPQLDETGLTGEVVLAESGSNHEACTAITNDVDGRIALIDRGTCTFGSKVQAAEEAGASGVLIADNEETFPAGMSGGGEVIDIPSVRIRKSDGTTMKNTLRAGDAVEVTMRATDVERTESYRWLMGEDATAFGSAIRDMWEPTCLGNPGKVSDVQYFCGDSDNGGVHMNSGVPNHTYALAVDGGTYNDVAVTGIGLDKAANIWWRAQDAYQTPSTDFADHADQLGRACADLTGQQVNRLSFTEGASPGTVTITATDCAAVEAAIDATELRADPEDTCNPTTPEPDPVSTTTRATHRPNPKKYTKPSTVTVRVKAAEGVATGKVQVRKKSGKVLVRGSLSAGKAALRLKKKSLPVGRNVVTVVYLGNDSFLTSSTRLTIKVKKR